MPLFRPQELPSFSRLGWLMGLYADNHQRIARMLDLGRFDQPGIWISSCGNGLDVVIEVLEVHAYTLELRISYQLCDPVTGQPDPSAGQPARPLQSRSDQRLQPGREDRHLPQGRQRAERDDVRRRLE